MSANLPLSIGAAARLTGCSVPTIRYYEQVGLLPQPPRSEGNQRHYDGGALRRLAFIRRCRGFGFSLEQVRELVGLVEQPQRDCIELREVARDQLRAVRAKLLELHGLEADLARIVEGCTQACAGGPAVDCTILEEFAAPCKAPAAPAADAGSCCARP